MASNKKKISHLAPGEKFSDSTLIIVSSVNTKQF